MNLSPHKLCIDFVATEPCDIRIKGAQADGLASAKLLRGFGNHGTIYGEGVDGNSLASEHAFARRGDNFMDFMEGLMPKKSNAQTSDRNAPQVTRELKVTEFNFEAPEAQSVQLAADFTGWERSALNLTRAENGLWAVSVPLSPGNYSYRFIVDGEWRDDPRSQKFELNPFGTINAVLNIS